MEQMIDLKQIMQDEQIERYLQNQMSAHEERLFEASLREDAVLRKRARFVAQTIKALRKVDQEETTMELEHRMVAKNPLAKK